VSLQPGTRLGPYEVTGPLGAGGMGEVYRATDTRLKRQVAIKILPIALAADPDRLARFQREAEVLASLNHPQIAAIYGLEDAGGMKALVMELVEGPTLADRITQGPIPFHEALPIARQIAAALEAAHERGIVHRDLKPANIKVRDDGAVKVLDFGLAKLSDSSANSGLGTGRDDPSQSPTLVSPVALSHSPTLQSPANVTSAGIILGTAAYMSPEQARGKNVDKRTDVWAFGAVLYEMLTGRRAFAGDDVTDVIAEVVKSTPAWDALPADVPSSVVALIQRCLEKDRNARAGDIAVARFLLAEDGPAQTGRHISPAAGGRFVRTLPWIAAALLGGAGIGWLLPRNTATPQPVTHLRLDVAPAAQLVPSIARDRPSRTAVALSPDGRLVVFAGLTSSGTTMLYARPLDRPEGTALSGTDGADAPFLSPDGAWIGFWSGNQLRKVAATGGPAAAICDVPGNRVWGASWSQDGTIFFSNGSNIFRVSSGGGAPEAVTKADPARGERHLLPQTLPGDRAILYTAVAQTDWDTADVMVQPLDGGAPAVVIDGGADARYVDTGHLVYMKSGTLMAVPFDARSRQTTGTPRALIEGVMQGINAPNGFDETGAGQFAVSQSGTLLYATGGINPVVQRRLVWLDRKGVEHPTMVPAGPLLSPRLSPDNQKIVALQRRGATRASDIWVYDVARGAATRLTFEGDQGAPVWSADGQRIIFNAARLHAIAADGSGKPEQIADGAALQTPSSAGANGIAFLQRPTPETFGIWVLPPGGRTARLVHESRYVLRYPEFSPDGNWIAYVSTESGSAEIYVQRYGGGGEKVRISTNGGAEPIWTRDGREILYRTVVDAKAQFMSVAIRFGPPFAADPPRLLLETDDLYDGTTPVRGWDVSADGQRFLMVKALPGADQAVKSMNVVLNWTGELTRTRN
jgi:Tol biopolymer transport system component